MIKKIRCSLITLILWKQIEIGKIWLVRGIQVCITVTWCSLYNQFAFVLIANFRYQTLQNQSTRRLNTKKKGMRWHNLRWDVDLIELKMKPEHNAKAKKACKLLCDSNYFTSSILIRKWELMNCVSFYAKLNDSQNNDKILFCILINFKKPFWPKCIKNR